MQHSEQPFVELKRAQAAVDAMRESKSPQEIEDHWKEFLHRIERVWTKSMNHFGKSPKWPNWHGKYLQLRRKDQLLSYLINARGADEHTVTEITKKEDASLTVHVKPGERMLVNKLGFNPDGTPIVDVEGSGEVVFTPGKVKPLSVTNRGNTYEAPKAHLSKAINSESLIDIAEQGLTFYEDFLNSAEKYFVSAASS